MIIFIWSVEYRKTAPNASSPSNVGHFFEEAQALVSHINGTGNPIEGPVFLKHFDSSSENQTWFWVTRTGTGD